MADPYIALADGQRTWYATRFLPHRCTVERPSGTGPSAAWTTAASNVPCRFVAAAPQQWGLEPGAIVGKVVYTVRVAAATDIRQGDRLTRTDVSTGERPLVKSIRPAGAYDPARLVLAEWRA